MASEKQFEANRANAQLSTGPTSEEGKARSSQNAVKHGFTARQLVIDEGEEAYFQQFADGITKDLNPGNQLELGLVDQIISCLWRQRRIPRIEADLFKSLLAKPCKTLGEHLCDREVLNLYSSISQNEIRIGRSLARAMKELKELKEYAFEENEPIQTEWQDEPEYEGEEIDEVGRWVGESIDEMEALRRDLREMNEILEHGGFLLSSCQDAAESIEKYESIEPEKMTPNETVCLDRARSSLDRNSERLQEFIESVKRIRKARKYKTKPIRYDLFLKAAVEEAVEMFNEGSKRKKEG
jgi:hypothetical protein